MAKRKKSKGKSRGKSRGRTKAARSRAAKKGWATRRSRGLSASLGLARHRSYGISRTRTKGRQSQSLGASQHEILHFDLYNKIFSAKKIRDLRQIKKTYEKFFGEKRITDEEFQNLNSAFKTKESSF